MVVKPGKIYCQTFSNAFMRPPDIIYQRLFEVRRLDTEPFQRMTILASSLSKGRPFNKDCTIDIDANLPDTVEVPVTNLPLYINLPYKTESFMHYFKS